MPPVKPLFGTPLNRAHPLAQGLVLSLLLNEGSGNKAYDSSGNENHGTLTGFSDPATATSGWCAGPHGGALRFDGADDYILGPNKPHPQAGFSIIISLNMKSSQDCELVHKGSVFFNGAPSGTDFEFGIVENNLYFQFHGLDGASNTMNVVAPSLNIIHQLSAIFYSGSRMCIFIDGLQSGQYNISSTSIEASAGPIHISYPTFKLLGNVDYVYIYDRALSASEVAYLNAFPYCMFDQPDDPNYDFTKYFYRNKKIHANLIAVSFLQAIPEKQAEIQAILSSLALVSGKSELIREIQSILSSKSLLSGQAESSRDISATLQALGILEGRSEQDREIFANLSAVSLVEGTANRLHELQAILQAVSALSGQAEISREVSADLQAIGFPEAVAEAIRIFYELTAQLVAIGQGSANASMEQDISAQLIAIAALNGRALTHYRTVVLQFETIMKKYLHDQTIF